MKNFLKEILDPIKDFYVIRKKTELLTLISVPISISILCYLISVVIKNFNGIDAYDFSSDIINQLITILTLFVSFSMAYLSIIIASSSENINGLKETDSKSYFLKGKPCKLYQVLLSEITYTLVIDIFFLVFVVFQKFLLSICNVTALKILLSIDSGMFVHVLLIMLVLIKNIYYSFWKPE